MILMSKHKWGFPDIGVPQSSSISRWGFLIHHPFWGTTILGNPQLTSKSLLFGFDASGKRKMAESSKVLAKDFPMGRSTKQPSSREPMAAHGGPFRMGWGEISYIIFLSVLPQNGSLKPASDTSVISFALSDYPQSKIDQNIRKRGVLECMLFPVIREIHGKQHLRYLCMAS